MEQYNDEDINIFYDNDNGNGKKDILLYKELSAREKQFDIEFDKLSNKTDINALTKKYLDDLDKIESKYK